VIDDIDDIIRRGESKTAELNSKYAQLSFDELQIFNNPGAQGTSTQWEGEEYGGRKGGAGKLANMLWIEPSKRERKSVGYSVDGYYRGALHTGPGRPPGTRGPRRPRPAAADDYKFYPPRLHEIQEKEQLYQKVRPSSLSRRPPLAPLGSTAADPRSTLPPRFPARRSSARRRPSCASTRRSPRRSSSRSASPSRRRSTTPSRSPRRRPRRRRSSSARASATGPSASSRASSAASRRTAATTTSTSRQRCRPRRSTRSASTPRCSGSGTRRSTVRPLSLSVPPSLSRDTFADVVPAAVRSQTGSATSPRSRRPRRAARRRIASGSSSSSASTRSSTRSRSSRSSTPTRPRASRTRRTRTGSSSSRSPSTASTRRSASSATLWSSPPSASTGSSRVCVLAPSRPSSLPDSQLT